MADNNNKLCARLRPLEANRSMSIIEIDNFKANLLFMLSDNQRFGTILSNPETLTWIPADEDANRGFEDDTSAVSSDRRQTGSQKKLTLEYMLGIISGYIEILSRSFIVHQARSLEEIWGRIRTYYGCRKTGGQIMKLLKFKIGDAETHEALWERMYAHLEDSLFDPKDKIIHPNNPTTKDKMSPTMLNILVTEWLRAIDISLPDLVLQKYATELRNNTMFSIREDISVTMLSLRQEIETMSISRVQQTRYQRPPMPPTQHRSCCLCKASNRTSTNHFLCDCPYLPAADKSYVQSLRNRSKPSTRCVEIEDMVDTSTAEEAHSDYDTTGINRVSLESSPILKTKFGDQEVTITLDSGAEANLIRQDEVSRLGLKIIHNRQTANQADGKTPLVILGECHFTVTHGHHNLNLNCLVVTHLSCSVLAGVPFHTENDIFVRMSQGTVYLGDCCVEKYIHDKVDTRNFAPKPAATRTASILRITSQMTLMPGESMTFTLPIDFRSETVIAIEPRLQAPSFATSSRPWLSPTLESVEDGTIQIRNSTDEPIKLGRHEQVCNILRTELFNLDPTRKRSEYITDSKRIPGLPPGTFYSDAVQVDPNSQLTQATRDKFLALNRKYDDAFDTKVGLYNGNSGPYEAVINVGNTQPTQTRGRCPQYSHANKVILQDKCDELERNGVLATPESLGVAVENVNPSFLISKPNGGYRFVTKFGGIAEYVKPQPSLLPNVNDTLRSIGKWKYIIKSDLSDSYYQIPLSKRSMKYCGVCTPFKGLRVYTRCAMGLPGSETALEELLCRILGHLIAEEKVVKIADDLYCGSNSPEGVYAIWEEVLNLLHINGLHISAKKTAICPASTTILGWVWNNGSISASPHRLSALEVCKPATTVFGLRSFIGAFKFLGKVLPAYSDVLSPLEAAVAGRESKERITWTNELETHYKAAQRHLSKAKSIVLPREEDEIRIVTDASVSKCGLAATLYIIRKGKVHLAGFFNAKMTPNQLKWLPCEVEALCIGAAVRTFSPYIVQSKHRTQVLSDSKPCVQAYEKLCRGEFSNSARVMTFLSILCDYGVKLGHIRGCENLIADFSSRNPVECANKSCQICKFISETEESVVRAIELNDITSTTSVEMFTNRAAWKSIQKSCPTLRRVHAQLEQGTRPLKNARHIGEVRRLLRVCKIANDGLLVVHNNVGLSSDKDRIVIPTNITHGIVTAFHLKLTHPSRSQLLKVMNRQFYAINLADAIGKVHSNCDTCSAIQNIPTQFKEQSTKTPSDIGLQFSADVIRRSRQMILVTRENITAYTHACIIQNETADSLRDGLLLLISLYRSSCGQSVEIRVDPAPGFRALVQDKTLCKYGIKLVIGDEKNLNKNPIAERSISEIHAQLTRLQPAGGKISPSTLALAISNVNSQLRNCGLSAQEIWTQRDQFSGKQIPISDRDIILQRERQRVQNHPSSAKYKARGRTHPIHANISVGDLVYLYQDRDKVKSRDRYIVTSMDKTCCTVQKFVGAQLRTRSYRVSLTDCIVIQSSVIRETINYDNLDDDYVHFEPRSPGNNLEHQAPPIDMNINLDNSLQSIDNDQNSDNSLLEEPDVENDSIVINPDRLRPQRNIRRPVRFNDYTSDFSDEDSDD